ncbi:MAG TPA: VOC family protein [Bdellovibrio sp.]|uniref:VOC family protein n=1 Tax=Bdellovibrio sp. TaxID=28201 RepID=UPI002EF802AC
MKYGYTILYVDDVPKTVSFYENAFGLKKLFVHESNAYAEMETGTTRLAFTAKSLAQENGLDFGQLGKLSSPPPFELALVSEDVDSSFEMAIAHGAAELKKPVQKPWGQRVGYVRDCNGFLVEICSPLE